MLMLTIFIAISFNFTYARFVQNVKVSGKSKVANFSFSTNVGKNIVKDVLNTDDEIIYEFSVQNFSGNISSEVKSKYNISLELSQNNPPLIIELYRVKSGKEELVTLENYTTKVPETFDIGSKTSNYKIKVRYDKNNKTLLKEGFNIKLKIVNIQKEG